MAASICMRKVGNKWTNFIRPHYRFLTIISERTYYKRSICSSSETTRRQVASFSDTALHYERLCLPCENTYKYGIPTEPQFGTFINCYKMTQEENNNVFCSGKSLHSQNRLNEKSNCQVRHYSDGNGPDKSLPHLMEFPEILWPSLIKTLRNWILANLIITPYFDQEFNMPDFSFGSKQALEYVSGCLSRGDYEALLGLVSEETLREVKRNVATFSVHQRQLLAISKDDIYFSFPYQIGVMFNDDDKNQQRFVEITMVYHTLQGLTELRDQGAAVPLNIGTMAEYKDKIIISNYRFIREFTKGVESQWTVNVLNHFRPADV